MLKALRSRFKKNWVSNVDILQEVWLKTSTNATLNTISVVGPSSWQSNVLLVLYIFNSSFALWDTKQKNWVTFEHLYIFPQKIIKKQQRKGLITADVHQLLLQHDIKSGVHTGKQDGTSRENGTAKHLKIPYCAEFSALRKWTLKHIEVTTCLSCHDVDATC